MTMKQIRLSIVVDLPDDLFVAAELIAKLNAPWSSMVTVLQDNEMAHEYHTEVVNCDPKAREVRRRAGRKAPKRTRVPFMPLAPTLTNEEKEVTE